MVRITPKEAQDMMNAYSKVYAPKEEPKPETEAATEKLLGEAATEKHLRLGGGGRPRQRRGPASR